jgi:hypothetical protein
MRYLEGLQAQVSDVLSLEFELWPGNSSILLNWL